MRVLQQGIQSTERQVRLPVLRQGMEPEAEERAEAEEERRLMSLGCLNNVRAEPT